MAAEWYLIVVLILFPLWLIMLSIFHVLISHLYKYVFGERCIQNLLPISKLDYVSLFLSCKSFLYILDINSLIHDLQIFQGSREKNIASNWNASCYETVVLTHVMNSCAAFQDNLDLVFSHLETGPVIYWWEIACVICSHLCVWGGVCAYTPMGNCLESYIGKALTGVVSEWYDWGWFPPPPVLNLSVCRL